MVSDAQRLAASAPLSPAARRRVLRHIAWVSVALLCIVLAGWLTYRASMRRGTDNLRAEANHQLDLFASAVQAMVRRLEPLPATVQLSTEVQALLHEPARADRVEAASLYLRRLNAHLNSVAAYVLGPQGQVLASSDPDLLGKNLSFRPYFQDAMAGRVGRHFAIGESGDSAGYFVSHPIHDGARVAGVAVIEISLEPVGQAWSMLGAPALLVDSNQVVILSSRPEWQYTSLGEVPPERRADFRATRLYGGHAIQRFPLEVDLRVDEDSQIVEGVLPEGLNRPRSRLGTHRGMLVLGRTLDGMDWRLLMFADLQGVRRQAVQNSLAACVGMGFIVLLAVLLHQRRRIVRQKLRLNAELEAKVALRTQALSETNIRLRKEVREREQAEQTLREAQDELVHAGKMAALGQLATGITHELTQPLGAIRTLSANAVEFMRRGQMQPVTGNLEIMARLADQMGAIIEPLKGFARKSKAQPQPADLRQAVHNALFLYQQRLRQLEVLVHDGTEGSTLRAWCDPNRLEQVLINLIGNALDAMAAPRGPAQPPRALWFELSLAKDPADTEGGPSARVRLTVRDNGPGLSAELCERVAGWAWGWPSRATSSAKLAASWRPTITLRAALDSRCGCRPCPRKLRSPTPGGVRHESGTFGAAGRRRPADAAGLPAGHAAGWPECAGRGLCRGGPPTHQCGLPGHRGDRHAPAGRRWPVAGAPLPRAGGRAAGHHDHRPWRCQPGGGGHAQRRL
jgi:C4-dicarboxylate-specific signal transduction histidine kinase